VSLTPAQLGTKSKQMPGHVRSAEEVGRSPHLGRTSKMSANYMDRRFQSGKLVMMDVGLHRVVSAEPISVRHFFGIPCTISAVSSSAVTVKLDDSNNLGANSQALDLSAITPVVGDQFILGAQTYRQETQHVTVDGVSGGNLGSASGSVLSIAETIVTGRIAVGDSALMLRLPKATTGAGAAVIDPLSIDMLQPTVPGSSTDIPVYHLSMGVSEHPSFIARTGSTTSMQDHEYEDLTAVVVNTDGNKSVDGDQIGTGTTFTQVGVIGPSLRVLQPKGVVRFAADEVNTLNISSDKILQGKSGMLEVHNSSESNMNPHFDIWVGAGEEVSPDFQIMNRHTNAPLIAPYVAFVGWKYRMRPVPERELRNMLRRSGKFKYEIIPTSFTRANAQGDGRSAPTQGWKELVEQNRGRKLSLEDYKRATEQTSSQTRNILYGTTGSRNPSGAEDPRNRHRGGI